jgi:plasmid stabilization system protein ParE
VVDERCAHPGHAALRAGHDALRAAGRAPLPVDHLRCGVRQVRRSSADLADALADLAHHRAVGQAQCDTRPGSPPADHTVREVERELHAVARHPHVGDVLLEPSDDDLAHLRHPAAGGRPTVRSGRPVLSPRASCTCAPSRPGSCAR